MPPQVRRRPLGPPSAITTGVSQRRSGGGLEGMGNSILSAAISQLLSGSDGDEDPSTLSPVPESRFLWTFNDRSRPTIGTGRPDSGGFLPSTTDPSRVSESTIGTGRPDSGGFLPSTGTGSMIGEDVESIPEMLERRRRLRRL